MFTQLLEKCQESRLLLKHCAGIYKGKKLITSATNNHRSTFDCSPTYGLHAEQQAILQLLALHGLTSQLRLDRNGKWCFLWGTRPPT